MHDPNVPRGQRSDIRVRPRLSTLTVWFLAATPAKNTGAPGGPGGGTFTICDATAAGLPLQ